MKEVKQLTKILYGVDCVDSKVSQASQSQAESQSYSQSQSQGKENAAASVNGRRTAAFSQSQSQSDNCSQGSTSSATKSAQGNFLCPLHRDDPLYLCRDASEQVQYAHTNVHTHTRSYIRTCAHATAKTTYSL
jgi:spore germination protein GerM